MPYTVRVADNGRYMDEEAVYEQGRYETLEEAEAACHKIVDDFLALKREPGMSAEMLFNLYTAFGEVPYIVGAASEERFSAWGYARERRRAMSKG
jgi:hypothetical protein